MVTSPRSGSAKGFTLIELLIIIGIIGFLASAILVAVDPVKRIQDARDAKRWSEVNAILNAILTKQVDDRALYNGDAATPILDQSGNNVQIIVEAVGDTDCTDPTLRPGCEQSVSEVGVECVAQLHSTTPEQSLDPTYIAAIPQDPAGGTPCITGSGCTLEGDRAVGVNNSGYYIARKNSRLEIGACKPDQASSISVKR